MQRPRVKIAFVSLMLLTVAVRVAAGQGGAAVSGVVRDAQGVAQLGALVQVVANNSAVLGTAFTDLHGRYLIPHLVPGKYEVRASAALFVPAMRDNLQLRAGAQAVVNLTLNTLFESATWIPAERRKADEPSDDWKWTMRSAANRPILRLAEDGDVILVSSSAAEPPRKQAQAEDSFTANADQPLASATNGLRRVPRPVISTSTTSPALRSGELPSVPIQIMSPG